jgi:hypothetical protein
MRFTLPIAVLFSSLFYAFVPMRSDCDKIPPLNKKIVSFVRENIGKKVGRGECWDLAAQALNSAGAEWDQDYQFGRTIDYKAEECIFPGDIIQFENVSILYQNGNTVYSETLAHHTAIVYKVEGRGKFVLAQQNTSRHGRKVALDPIDLANIKKGSFVIYRPS